MYCALSAYGNFKPVFGGVSRMSLEEVAALISRTSMTAATEEWTAADRALWKAATLKQRRAALRLRWHLRASTDPRALPAPTCPVSALLRAHELAYRDVSACRGGRDE